MTLKFFYESRGLLKSGKVYWEQWTFNFSIQEKSQQGIDAFPCNHMPTVSFRLSSVSQRGVVTAHESSLRDLPRHLSVELFCCYFCPPYFIRDEDHIPLQSKGIPLTIKDEQPFMFEVLLNSYAS